jgi:hypothetical protein
MNTKKPNKPADGFEPAASSGETLDELLASGAVSARDAELWASVIGAARADADRRNDRAAFQAKRIARIAGEASRNAPIRGYAPAAPVFSAWRAGAVAAMVLMAFTAGFVAARWTAPASVEMAAAPVAAEQPSARAVESVMAVQQPFESGVESAPQEVWEVTDSVVVSALRIDRPMRIEAKDHPIWIGKTAKPMADAS